MKRKRVVKALTFVTAVCVFSQTLLFSLQGSVGNMPGRSKSIIEFAGSDVYAAENTPSESGDKILAGERFEVDGIGYRKLTEHTVQLTDWEGAAGNIEIPEKVPGTELTVVSIGNGVFFDNAQIYQVDMPDTITDIGANAFDGASWTTITTLPPNLISIGERAFCAANRHAGMEEYDLVIPDSVTSIGRTAFGSQNYIRSVKLPKNLARLEESVFTGCEKMTNVTFPESLKSIGKNAFRDCKQLNNIDLPDGLEEIKGSAFSGCIALTEITLPDTITVLEGGLFSRCSSLEAVTLPGSLKEIKGSVFDSCRALREIRIPEGVTRLDAGWFDSCETQPAVYLEGSLSYVHVWFCGTSYSVRPKCNLEIHCVDEASAARLFSVGHKNIKVNGAAYEPDEADMQFDYEGLSYVILDPDKKLVRLKGKSASAQAVTEELIIPGKVKDANETEYTVTEIGYRAFPGSKITKVVFPDTIVHIEKEAFENCKTLEEMTLPKGLVSLGSSVFAGCTGLRGSLTVPDGCIDIYNGLSGTGYSEIILSENITRLRESALAGCKNLKSVTLPENLTEIGFGVFQNLTELETVNTPKHLKEIGEIAFKGCTNLKNAPLSDELVYIGPNAFDGCASLSGTLVIPDSTEVIYEGAFNGCTGLSGIQAGKGLKLLTAGALPDAEEITSYDSRVLEILMQNASYTGDTKIRLLWDGKSDIPAGAQVWAEDDLVISGSLTIGPGAVVTIAPDASLTVEADAELMIEEDGRFVISAGASAEINGTLTNEGRVEGSGQFTVNGTLNGTGSFGEGMQVILALTAEMVADPADVSYSMTPASPEPEVSAVFGGNKIIFEKDRDFTYSYANNMRPGQADVTVTPKSGGKLAGNPVTKHFTIHKAAQAAPECTVTFEENADGKTFTAAIAAVEGAEYSFDGETWTEENTKSDCQPVTEYTVYVRLKETDTHLAGAFAQKTMISPKLSQKAPECIVTFEENADKKTFTAVIAAVEGAEYSFDGETWTEENKKEDCQPKTEYTAYIRMKETETRFASPASEKTLFSPEIKSSVLPPAELAAPAIKSLKAAAGKTGVYVQIEVMPAANADRYEIYRISGKKTVLIQTTESKGTIALDKKPVKSAKYYAVAVSKDGQTKSAAGEQKAIKLAKKTKIRKVSSSSGGIRIAWKKVKNAKKYVIYRSAKKKSGYKKVKTLGKKKLSYIDKKAKKGKKYYYKIVVLTKSQPSLMSAASKKVKR